MHTRPHNTETMAKIIEPVTLWPAFQSQVQRAIVELIHEHTAEVVANAKRTTGVIPFEQRVELWLRFCAIHRAVDVGLWEFSDELNKALGRVQRFQFNRA